VRGNPEHGCGPTPRAGIFYLRGPEIFPIAVRSRELKLRAARPHYSPDFYAAYVRDPDGNKLAAVCRGYVE
jgi:hypothetical protein